MHADDAALMVIALQLGGIALASVFSDARSPTSRAMAAALSWVAAAITVNVLIAAPMHARHEVPWWDGAFAIPETLAIIWALEWLLRVLRTAHGGRVREGRLLRIAQFLAVAYGLASLALPYLRAHQFVNVLRHEPGDLHTPQLGSFLIFAAPLLGSLLLAAWAGMHVYRCEADRAEVSRVTAFLAGSPFVAAAMILPLHIAPFAAALGLVLFLAGSMRFNVAQGQRAAFLARFLSPQVATLVARQGLASATRVRTIEISVVSCDLRGFTAYSVANSSERVIEILREFYDAVGIAALECGATIKDQAGDGVLLLLGAPIDAPDHARRALKLAAEIRRRGIHLTRRMSAGELSLGVGVGVASGPVTVGVIGAASRLEYTAVGPAVNLACRLCGEAAAGEVLVAQATREAAQADELVFARGLQLKGFAGETPAYAMPAPGQ